MLSKLTKSFQKKLTHKDGKTRVFSSEVHDLDNKDLTFKLKNKSDKCR